MKLPLSALILVAITGASVVLVVSNQPDDVPLASAEPTEEECMAQELSPELEAACEAEGLLPESPLGP